MSLLSSVVTGAVSGGLNAVFQPFKKSVSPSLTATLKNPVQPAMGPFQKSVPPSLSQAMQKPITPTPFKTQAPQIPLATTQVIQKPQAPAVMSTTRLDTIKSKLQSGGSISADDYQFFTKNGGQETLKKEAAQKAPVLKKDVGDIQDAVAKIFNPIAKTLNAVANPVTTVTGKKLPTIQEKGILMTEEQKNRYGLNAPLPLPGGIGEKTAQDIAKTRQQTQQVKDIFHKFTSDLKTKMPFVGKTFATFLETPFDTIDSVIQNKGTVDKLFTQKKYLQAATQGAVDIGRVAYLPATTEFSAAMELPGVNETIKPAFEWALGKSQGLARAVKDKAIDTGLLNRLGTTQVAEISQATDKLIDQYMPVLGMHEAIKLAGHAFNVGAELMGHVNEQSGENIPQTTGVAGWNSGQSEGLHPEVQKVVNAFHKEGEMGGVKLNPEVQKIADKTQKMTENGLSEYDPIVSDKLMENGRKQIKPREAFEKPINKVTTEWYDQYSSLLREDKAGSTAKSYIVASNFKNKLAENVTLGADDLKEIYGAVPARLQTTFDDVQIHQHLLDRGKQGIDNPSGITTAQASARLEDITSKLTPEDAQIITTAQSKLQEWKKKNIIQPLIDSGVIDEATARDWEQKYPNHLPVQVVHYLEGNGMTDANTTLKSSQKKFLTKAEGTDSQLDTDTYRVRLRQLMQVQASIQKDHVAGQILKDFGEPMGDKSITKEQFEARNPGKSFIVDPASGGRFILPKEIESVVNNLHGESMGIVEGAFSKLSGLLRSGATSSRIAFSVFTNPLRDPQSVKMLMGSKFSYVRDWAPSIVESLMNSMGIRKSEYIEALKRQGGLNSGAITSENVNLRQRDLTPFNRQTKGQKVLTVISKVNPVNVVAKTMGEAFEEGTRVAATKAWDKMSPAEQAKTVKRLNPKYESYVVGEGKASAEDLRAFISKRSTLDFGQMGTQMKIVNRIIPFLNANQKGFARTTQLAMNDPKTFAYNSFKYSLLPTLMVYAWNQQQGGEGDIDPTTKAKYFAIKTGTTTTDDNGDEKPLLVLVPKGESGINEVSNLLQGTLNAVFEKNPKLLQQANPVLYNIATGDAKGAAQATGSKITDLMRLPGFTPLFEAMANYDTFKQRPIVPQSLQGVSPENQYKLRTPGVYKQLGAWAGLSPLQIEHLVNGIYPAASQYTTVADVATGKQPAGINASSQFMPLLRPSYSSDPEVDAAYQSKASTDTKVADNHFKIRDKIDSFIRAGAEKGKPMATEYFKTLEADDFDYASDYFMKSIEKKSKPALDNVVSGMSSAEAVDYAAPKLDKAIAAKDKAEVAKIVQSFPDGSKAQEAVIDYFLSKVGENQ